MNLEEMAQQKLTADINKANAYFQQTFPSPSLSFNQRGKIAGCALLAKNHIRLNLRLFEDNVSVFIEDVITHELAHLLAFNLFGKVKPHGPEWQSIMIKVFNRPPSTRHVMDTSKVRGKVFPYACQCSEHELSIRRHNKVMKNQQNYICKLCKQALKPLLSEHLI